MFKIGDRVQVRDNAQHRAYFDSHRISYHFVVLGIRPACDRMDELIRYDEFDNWVYSHRVMHEAGPW